MFLKNTFLLKSIVLITFLFIKLNIALSNNIGLNISGISKFNKNLIKISYAIIAYIKQALYPLTSNIPKPCEFFDPKPVFQANFNISSLPLILYIPSYEIIQLFL
jgi:hypothetical protein